MPFFHQLFLSLSTNKSKLPPQPVGEKSKISTAIGGVSPPQPVGGPSVLSLLQTRKHNHKYRLT